MMGMMDPEALLEAIKMMRQKLKKMEMEYEKVMGDEERQDGEDNLSVDNMENSEDMQSEAPTKPASGQTGDDGEEEISIEMSSEGREEENPLAALHRRMKEEMSQPPRSRMAKAKGSKFGGM